MKPIVSRYAQRSGAFEKIRGTMFSFFERPKSGLPEDNRVLRRLDGPDIIGFEGDVLNHTVLDITE